MDPGLKLSVSVEREEEIEEYRHTYDIERFGALLKITLSLKGDRKTVVNVRARDVIRMRDHVGGELALFKRGLKEPGISLAEVTIEPALGFHGFREEEEPTPGRSGKLVHVWIV